MSRAARKASCRAAVGEATCSRFRNVPPGPQPVEALRVEGALAVVGHVVDGEAGDDQVERARRPAGGRRGRARRSTTRSSPAKRSPGPGQHLGVEVQAHAGRARAGGQHQVEQPPVAGAQVQHPLDPLGQQLHEDGRALRPVREVVRLREVGQRVLDVRPAVLRCSHPRACPRRSPPPGRSPRRSRSGSGEGGGAGLGVADEGVAGGLERGGDRAVQQVGARGRRPGGRRGVGPRGPGPGPRRAGPARRRRAGRGRRTPAPCRPTSPTARAQARTCSGVRWVSVVRSMRQSGSFSHSRRWRKARAEGGSPGAPGRRLGLAVAGQRRRSGVRRPVGRDVGADAHAVDHPDHASPAARRSPG